MRLINGDCLEVMPTLASESVDCVVCDPPYPHIRRSYGYWTEEEWWALMMPVVSEVRRLLKPTGSAVFILQPNSEKVGRMRPWLWEFMAWVCREWNMVQDVWWWNPAMLPNGGATNKGTLRASVKACIWAGSPDCYRGQQAVLLPISERHLKRNHETDYYRKEQFQSGNSMNAARCRAASLRRGGTTPFNLLPVTKGGEENREASGHCAGTPSALADWWLRYICPPGGTVLDPFSGSGTVVLAALKQGKDAIGIERIPEYHAIAERRVAELYASTPLFS